MPFQDCLGFGDGDGVGHQFPECNGFLGQYPSLRVG